MTQNAETANMRKERKKERKREKKKKKWRCKLADPGRARPRPCTTPVSFTGIFFFFFPFSSLINTYSSLMNTYFKELLLLLSFSDEHIFSGIAVAAVVVVFLAVVVVVFFLDVNRVLETRFSGRRHVEKVPH